MKLGFRARFTHHRDRIRSAATGKNYAPADFAVVRSYPVDLSKGHSGMIEYIVLNSGKLGFILSETEEIKTNQKQMELIPENIDY